MSDFDSLTELLNGRHPVTDEQLTAVERSLVMLRALRAEVWSNAWTITPSPTGAWRSAAADRYAERLGELRGLLIASRDAIDRAEQALERCITRMRAQLDEQMARAPR